MKGQIRDATVDVQMDAAKGQDLSETIDKIRHQYAKAAQKNREETEAWYQAKVRELFISRCFFFHIYIYIRNYSDSKADHSLRSYS